MGANCTFRSNLPVRMTYLYTGICAERNCNNELSYLLGLNHLKKYFSLFNK